MMACPPGWVREKRLAQAGHECALAPFRALSRRSQPAHARLGTNRSAAIGCLGTLLLIVIAETAGECMGRSRLADATDSREGR